MRRLAEDPRRGATLDDPAGLPEADLVGELATKSPLVGGDQHRHAVALAVASGVCGDSGN
jgi:hypothetical protein